MLRKKENGVWEDIQIILQHPKFRPLRHLFALWIIFTLIAGGYWAYTLMNAGVSHAATFADNTQTEFNTGTYSDTQWNTTNNWVDLTATGETNGSGSYTSLIKDSGGDSTWNSIAWTPERPTGKELPNNAVSETAYATGNANMTGNVLLMHMNEASGIIADTSGQGNNGTANSGVTYGTIGEFNTALSFNGTSGSVDVTGLTSTAKNYTFSFWVNSAVANSQWKYLADIQTGRLILAWNGNTAGKLSFHDSSSWYDFGTNAINDGAWHNVVFVFSGTSASLYVDGSQFGSTFTYTPVDLGGSIAIGSNYTGTNAYFNGSIDEVAIFDRALSATEILDNYKRGVGNLKFQVRSCNNTTCSGDTFIGPDGTASTYYEWGMTNSTTTPSLTLTNVPNNRYFQYKAFFDTATSTYTPELKTVTTDYTILNYVPNTPTNSTPITASTTVALLPTLIGSTYNDPDGDSHQASQWQVATSTSDFASTTWDSGATTTALESVTVQAPELKHNTTYAWRVRYQDSATLWSPYSATTTFTTNSISTPTNATPAASSTAVALTPTLTASAFLDGDSSHTHQASQWQVSTTTDFATTTWDSFATTTALANVVVGTALIHNTDYYWRVRYQDNTSQWSAYSVVTGFTTNIIHTPTNSTPLDSATVLTLTPLLTASAFLDGGSILTHTATQWQVDDNSDFSSPVYDSGVTASGEVSRAVPSGLLSNFSTYYWRVRYKDSSGTWSKYSTATKFSINISATSVAITPVFGKITVNQGDSVNIDVQVKNFTDGAPLNNATSTISIYNPSGTKIVNNVAMTYVTGSNGIYRYVYTIPLVSGSYLYEVKATSGNNSGYGASNFEVKTIAADVSSIKTIVTSEQTAQTAERTAQSAERTAQSAERSAQSAERTAQASSRANVSNILTDTSTTIPNQINTGTTTIVSGIKANEAKIDSLISNMDILIGAMIVTQSTVNDTSASPTSFITALTNSTDDFYKNAVLTFTSGSLNGQSRRISAYNSTTKTITLDPALTSAPANGDGFTIVKQNVRVQEQVAKVTTTVNDTNTKVTDIQNTVHSIKTLLTSVNSKIDTMQAAVSSVRTSQQALYNVEISGARAVQIGNIYRATLTIEDYETNPVSASSTPTILIYDSSRAVALATTTMTEISTGVYEATYAIPVGATSGLYESIISAHVGGSTITRTNYWQATGAPSQVIINSISDSSVPSISANVTISNEGNAPYEYKYEWCVVISQNNQCGGGNDIAYASAAKLVSPGASFNTTLKLTVPNAGNYWFKVVNYYGTKSSSASRSFTAVTKKASVSTGGGGFIAGSNVTTFNQLQLTSNQLLHALKGASTININVVGLSALLKVSNRNTETLKSIQNKLSELRAVSDTINAVVTNNSTLPIVQTFMQFNSVEFRFLITNPSSQKQTLKFKAALPQEATPEDIMNANGLSVKYDPNAHSYFVTAAIVLAGGESVVKKVEMRDIWVFAPEEISAKRAQAQKYANLLEKTQYGAQATLLMGEINSLLTAVGQTQAKSYNTPQNHIVVYRTNEARMAQVKTAVQKLEDLVTQSGASRGLLGSIGGIQTFATWGIILAVVFGFGLLAAIVFAMWRQQTMLITALGRHGRRIPGLKYPDVAPTISPGKLINDVAPLNEPAMSKAQNFTLYGYHDPKGFFARLVHIVSVFSESALGILILISFPGFVIGVLMFVIPSFIAKPVSIRTAPPTTAQTGGVSTTSTATSFETFTESPVQSASSTKQQVLINETPTGWLNVRSTASRDAKIIGKVYPSKEYTYTDKKDGWYKIILDNGSKNSSSESLAKEGWVFGEYVSIYGGSSGVSEFQQKVGTPTGSTTVSEKPVFTKVKILATPTGWLNVRSMPAPSEKLLGRVYPGNEYIFEAERNGWYYIVIPKGIDGWISGEYAKTIK